MNSIKIDMYGGLKDFFDAETILPVYTIKKLSEVIAELISLQPDAEELISKCAIAINGAISREDFLISEIHELALLPPYSGG